MTREDIHPPCPATSSGSRLPELSVRGDALRPEHRQPQAADGDRLPMTSIAKATGKSHERASPNRS